MANSLYTNYRILDGHNYCFKGHNNTLYCVGDSSIAYDILNFLKTNYSSINIIANNNILDDNYPRLTPDINWVNMSDIYLNDIFTRILDGYPCCTSRSYFNYSWDIIHRQSHEPISPLSIYLNGNLVSGTFVGDILPSNDYTYSLIATRQTDTYNISHPISFSGRHIPLSYVAFPNMTYRYYIPRYYVQRLVSNSIYYDGTYTCPRIFIDGDPIDHKLQDKILFQSLADEIKF